MQNWDRKLRYVIISYQVAQNEYLIVDFLNFYTNTYVILSLLHTGKKILARIQTVRLFSVVFTNEKRFLGSFVFLNSIALRKAKIVYNFGISECNRVNA